MGIDLTGISGVTDLAGGIMDRFWPKKMDEGEKASAKLGMISMIKGFQAKSDEAKKSVMVAELNQGDVYTKRARPTIVYGGLAIIFINHVIFPMFAWCVGVATVLFAGTITPELTNALVLPSFSLPAAFWASWTGVTGVYSIGRSMEKRGVTGMGGKIASMITGNKQP